MRRTLPLATLWLFLSLAAGAHGAPDDPHSLSNPDEIRVTHVVLDLDVDFERQVLDGTAELALEHVAGGAQQLVLDTRTLTIHRVEVHGAGEWAPAAFELGAPMAHLGRALTIAVAPASDRVRIHYTTDPSASGLQWLSPAQTAGKRHPFLFSQSQAIHARSWIPLQDSPQVRVTYDAVVRTPAELLAVMSADNDPGTPRDGEYHFHMPQPVPSYLIALAAGDLQFEPMSERTGVYAEPGVVEAAASEFSDTESMLSITEQLYGPYRWERYDLLILPPSFPFGGMENPRLSFITPTVIAGDKSLVSLIAHELAHSWSGNLVSNATWRDLWLNEGFTTYVTLRIMEAVYGTRRAVMEAALDLQDLETDLASLPDADEHLAVDLRGRDPDDVFSDVPYVKGSLLLRWIESRVGRERFDAFLRRYFDRFAFRSITTQQFLAYLDTELAHDSDALDMAQIKRWVYEPGIPKNAVLPKSDAFERVAALKDQWLADELSVSELPEHTDRWTVHEWRYFLNTLPERLPRGRLDALDSQFDLTHSRNNEIAHAWLLIAIHNDYRPAYDRLHDYLVGIGRRKLIQPLYEALMDTAHGREFARSVYGEARPGYHPIAITTIDRIVGRDAS